MKNALNKIWVTFLANVLLFPSNNPEHWGVMSTVVKDWEKQKSFTVESLEPETFLLLLLEEYQKYLLIHFLSHSATEWFIHSVPALLFALLSHSQIFTWIQFETYSLQSCQTLWPPGASPSSEPQPWSQWSEAPGALKQLAQSGSFVKETEDVKRKKNEGRLNLGATLTQAIERWHETGAERKKEVEQVMMDGCWRQKGGVGGWNNGRMGANGWMTK